MHGAGEATAVVDDHELQHLRRRFHQHHAIGSESMLGDRPRRLRHVRGDPGARRIAAGGERVAQVAVCEDAGDTVVAVDDDRHAHAFAGHLDDRRRERRIFAHARNRGAGAHHVGDARQQPAAERTARMRAREILDRESTRIEERQRQRVAQGKRRRRARRRREPERIGFAVDRRVEVYVGGLGERTLAVSRERDHPRALPLQVRGEHQELVGLARVRQHDDDVVRSDHAEVAVARLGGMHEECRRAGRRERRRYLPRDVAGLADARDDDSAAAREHQLDRGDEGTGEALREGADRARLGVEDVARERERALRVDRSRAGAARRRALIRWGRHRAEYTAAAC